MSRIKSFRFKTFALQACLAFGLSGFGSGGASAQSEVRTSIPSTGPAAIRPIQSIDMPTPPSPTGAAQPLRGPEQRVALVIGNSKYQNVKQLPNPDNDAKAMAQLLNAAGFEVIAATDLTLNEMIRAMQEFSAKIAAHGSNTVAMIYYAGHGVQLAGENYLIPVDAEISSPSDLVNNSLRLVDIMATLESIPSRLRIVVLDACRNNPFPNIDDAGRGLAIVDAPNGSIIGYSTAPGTQALDGSGEHSPYAASFLHLAREPNLPIEQLFKRVRLEVNRATDGAQTPWESSSLTSDFYFFGDTAVAATRAPARGPVVQMAANLPSHAVRQVYEFVLSEGSPEYYQEFIQLFPYDPLCMRIRRLLANVAEAAAWHEAVLANSPPAYKAFYDSHPNSPYAKVALKLQSEPKMLPSQPAHLMLPQHTGSQGVTFNNNLEGELHGGKIVSLPSPANGMPTKPTTVGKVVTFPVQTIDKAVSTHELKSDRVTGNAVNAPFNKKPQLRTERHEETQKPHENHAMKSNGNGARVQANAMPSRQASQFSPQPISRGGGFGRHH